MITEKDKYDLAVFSVGIIKESLGVDNRVAATNAVAKTLRFITDHPDMCAAEINDLLLSPNALAELTGAYIQQMFKEADGTL